MFHIKVCVALFLRRVLVDDLGLYTVFKVNLRKKIIRTEKNRPLHHVFKFTHVARPVIIQQSIHELRAHPAVKAVCLVETVHKGHGKKNYVVLPLIERQKLDRNYIEPVEQVLSELTFFNHAGKFPVGSNDYAYVNLGFRTAAYLYKGIFLNSTEKFGLIVLQRSPACRL